MYARSRRKNKLIFFSDFRVTVHIHSNIKYLTVILFPEKFSLWSQTHLYNVTCAVQFFNYSNRTLWRKCAGNLCIHYKHHTLFVNQKTQNLRKCMWKLRKQQQVTTSCQYMLPSAWGLLEDRREHRDVITVVIKISLQFTIRLRIIVTHGVQKH